jgi:hypothetical protein
MAGFLRKLFGSASATPAFTTTANAVQSAEESAALYDEFCRTFCHRPGVNFMEFLKSEGVTRMIDWLNPAIVSPLPKAFVRQMVNATRKGEQVWDMAAISLLLEGEGLPDQNSQDALSVLSQILEKPIKVFYRTTADSELMVLRFAP